MSTPATRPLSNAELLAELRQAALLIRLFGLDGLRRVEITRTPREAGQP